MKPGYPWVTVTFLSCWLFGGFYLITFFLTAMSYSLLWHVPADDSTEVSWIYYGVLFSVLPYMPMGFLLYRHIRQRPLLLCMHAAGTGLLLEKGGAAVLGYLLGYDPWSGNALLCEELPMYCGAFYFRSYVLWGTAAAFVAFYGGIRLARSRLHHTR
ncbi:MULTISPECIES: hypothetical protein [Paenibacillus]|uniref:hypothetical protein n=1 Tax=Paenibacillus TaxID=44249 RepID=UPI0022B8B68A|nr:hypothetical protein [Paenibacillus caseinilyticus]MCZ8517995.1 hypothetical protein [Paenibacillus caseinilyticus]